MLLYAKTKELLQSVQPDGILRQENWSRIRGQIIRGIKKYGFPVPIQVLLKTTYSVNANDWHTVLAADHMKLEFIPIELTIHMTATVNDRDCKPTETYVAERKILEQLAKFP